MAREADATTTYANPGMGELAPEDRERNLIIVGLLVFVASFGIICACFFRCLNYSDKISAFRVRRSARIEHQKGMRQESIEEERAAEAAKTLKKMATRSSRQIRKASTVGETNFWNNSFLGSVSSWDDLEDPAEPEPELSPKKKSRRKSKSRRQSWSATSEHADATSSPGTFSQESSPEQSRSKTSTDDPEVRNFQGSSPHSTEPNASETGQIVSDIMAKLGMELDRTQSRSLEWRRKHFKEILLRWHPDKNPQLYATAVFQKLMVLRVGYLDA